MFTPVSDICTFHLRWQMILLLNESLIFWLFVWGVGISACFVQKNKIFICIKVGQYYLKLFQVLRRWLK